MDRLEPSTRSWIYAGPPARQVAPSRELLRERTIVIVGAGFSGTSVAIHLLRSQHAATLERRPRLRVVLVERGELGCGVAYAKSEKPFLLNVPAGRMSATTTNPMEFLEFARGHLPQATAGDFLPRELYGRYLRATLLSAGRASPTHVSLEHVQGEVTGVDASGHGQRFRVNLEEGLSIDADTVVLAPGNPEPARLPGTEKLTPAQYIADPWRSSTAFRAGETVLAVGSGLTMADIALGGLNAAKGRATVHAISRHGLLPARQTDFHFTPDESHGRALLRESGSLRRLVRAVRALAEHTENRGGDWRETVTAVRDIAPRLWQRLPDRERSRFLRHVRCYWDVHRHRLPDCTWTALAERCRQGTLHVHAGRILEFAAADNKVRVTWRPRGASATSTLLVDRVINCTGPQYNVRQTREPLLRSLLDQGRLVPDSFGLGVETDDLGRLIGSNGRAGNNLYYVGPMLRPRYWETTAVQELRIHAERLAQHLASQITAQAGLPAPIP